MNRQITRFIYNKLPGTSLLLAPLLLAGCASTPEFNPELDALQRRYETVVSRQFASQEASGELNEARAAIELGYEAWDDNEDEELVHYMFVAGKTLDIAEERIALYETGLKIADSSDLRDEMVLAAREKELEEKERELAEKEALLAEKDRQLMLVEEQAQLLADELSEVEARFDERGTVLVLNDILFDFDSSELKAGSARVIDKIAEFLMNQQNQAITIEGHTDSVGSEEYNELLSLQRAQSVEEALMLSGVSDTRIGVEGMGEGYPVASNSTGEGRQMNRRVEIVINDQTRVSAR